MIFNGSIDKNFQLNFLSNEKVVLKGERTWNWKSDGEENVHLGWKYMEILVDTLACDNKSHRSTLSLGKRFSRVIAMMDKRCWGPWMEKSICKMNLNVNYASRFGSRRIKNVILSKHRGGSWAARFPWVFTFYRWNCWFRNMCGNFLKKKT